MSPIKSLAAAAAISGIGVLIGTAPASAAACCIGGYGNGTSLNSLTKVHSLHQSSLTPASAAVSDMNGVSVEGVTLPASIRR